MVDKEVNGILDNCINCKDIKLEMLKNNGDSHKRLGYIYHKLKQMYDDNKLQLVISDCSFENLMEEVSKEEQYTYRTYLKCNECETYFYLGICIRGCPVYKVTSCLPNIQEFIEMSERDGKKLYFGNDIKKT